MGLSDIFADFYSAIGFTEAYAEAPEQKEDESSNEAGEEAQSEDKEEGEDKEGGDEDKEDEEEPEEEEEEEDEPVDPKPKLEDECARSAQCAPFKHHFDDCVERVTAQQENPNHAGKHEDCVEEFFHLQHCATQCAAPKLFRALK